VFEVPSVNVILTTNCLGEHHEFSEIVYGEWRLLFCSTCLDRCL